MAATPATPGPALPELEELSALIDEASPWAGSRVAAEVDAAGHRLPVHVLTFGSNDPQAPAVGFFGGVHGLERIGARVVLAYLRSLVVRLRWDSALHETLAAVRLVFMPLVNPGGMLRGTRANPNGVDLMRNSPVDSREQTPFLLGGQRISASLPWYRGPAAGSMEVEARALCRTVEQELLGRPFSIAVDCHSGFGLFDRIWFPYAHTRLPIEHLAEMHALCEIFDQTHSAHNYVIEPQSRQYMTHGDLWDHLYDQALATGTTFLPLTLEMGSWLWVKKNPRQLFSRYGIFNPLIEHRHQRVLRRHLAWLDFLTRASQSHGRWLPQGNAREAHRQRALDRWYRAFSP